MQSEKRPLCRFAMTGFAQDGKFRRFAFERIEDDYTRTPFSVQADLNLTRVYGIHMQELPLLCRELLEQCADRIAPRAFTFTEDAMRTHKTERLAAAALKKGPRRPVSPNLGNAWRTGSLPIAPRS